MIAHRLRALLLLTFAILSAAQAFAQPNVILIVYDDVDYHGDLEPFGANSAELQTPFSNRLAAQGKKFDHFYTNGFFCSPTRMGLTTGHYPNHFGIGFVLPAEPIDRGVPALPTDLPTLARLFSGMGYATGAFGKWHLGTSRYEYTPAGVGFQTVAVNCGFGAAPSTTIGFPAGPDAYMIGTFCSAPRMPLMPDDGSGTHATEFTIGRALSFITDALDSGAGQPPGPNSTPFFAQIWLNAPHDPYHCPLGYTCSDNRSKVAAMIDHAEVQLERIHADLEERGVWNDTLVILASDNGGVNRSILASPTILQGRKGNPLERGVRTPFLIKGPGISPGVVTQSIIGHDLLTTLADYFSVSLPAYTGPGLSFKSLLIPGDPWPGANRALFWEGHIRPLAHYQPLFSPWVRYAVKKVVQGRVWKLVQTDLWSGGAIPQLYNFSASEAETSPNNLAFSQTAIRNHLMAEYSNWRMASSEHLPEIALTSGAVTVSGNPPIFTFSTPGPGQDYGVVQLEEHPATEIGGLHFSVSFEITPTQLSSGAARLVERSGLWSVYIRGDQRVEFSAKLNSGQTVAVLNRLPLQVGQTYRITAVFETQRGLSLYVNDVLGKLRQVVDSADPGANPPVRVGRGASNVQPFLGTLSKLAFHPIAVRTEDLELKGVYKTGFEVADPMPFTSANVGTIQVDTTEFFRGGRSLKHVATGNDSYTLPFDGALAESNAAGTEYQLTAWVKSLVNDTPVALFLFCRNDAVGGALTWDPRAFSSSRHLASTEWRRITHQHQCPPGTVSVNFRLDNDTAGRTVFWDELAIGRLGKSWVSLDFEGASSPIFAANGYGVGSPGRTGAKSLILPSSQESVREDFSFGGSNHFLTSLWAKTATPGSNSVRIWFYCLDSQNPPQPITQLTGNCPLNAYPHVGTDDGQNIDASCMRSLPGAVGDNWQKFSLSSSCPLGTAKVGIRLEVGDAGTSVLVDDLTVNITSLP